MISDFAKSLDLVTDETDFTVGSGAPSGSSQHFDFVQNIAVLGGLPDNILTIARASEVLPENASGSSVRRILANKLMMTTAGLHVWEQRTNTLSDSFNFTTWGKRGTPIIQDRNQLAPDGTLTASTINVGAAQNLDLFKVISGQSVSTNFEVSFFIERISTTGLLRAQRTSSNFSQTGQWDIDMSLLPDNWIRLTKNHPSVTILQNFKTGTTGLSGLFFFTPDGAERTFNLWGTQSEEGATVSPYVSTQGATVTRFKDEITQPVSQMGFGTNSGIIVIDLVTPRVGETGERAFFTLSDGTVNNRLIFLRETSVYRVKNHVAGASSVFTMTGITDSTAHKIAFGWTADGNFNVSVDGNSVQTFDVQGAGNFNPQTVFNLGSNEADISQLNSTIKSLTSYPDYSDALLQSRSA